MRLLLPQGGTAVVQWLRCCATNRKVAGSIQYGIIAIFHWHNTSDRTLALGSTQPLTEMNTSSISRRYRRPVCKADNLPPSCAVVMKSGNLNFLEPSGPVQACNGTDLLLPLPFYCHRTHMWTKLLYGCQGFFKHFTKKRYPYPKISIFVPEDLLP